MKSITWTRPLGEFDLRDDELPPRDPDTLTTIECPAVTIEMLEQEKRTRDQATRRPSERKRDSSEHRVLRQMSTLYAQYDRRPSGPTYRIIHRPGSD
jgi:hypothetical protein